jgi:hypothetical protein
LGKNPWAALFKRTLRRCAEKATSQILRSGLIKIIKHRLHEVLSYTLLRLQPLLREKSLSPQGVALIRMLLCSIKEELRVLPGLLAMVKSFIEELAEVEQNSDRKKLTMGDCLKIFRLSPASVKFVEVHDVINRDKLRSDAFWRNM